MFQLTSIDYFVRPVIKQSVDRVLGALVSTQFSKVILAFLTKLIIAS